MHKDFPGGLCNLQQVPAVFWQGEGRSESLEPFPTETAAPSNVNFRRNWQRG